MSLMIDPSALSDRVAELLKEAVDNDELIDSIARGFISPKEAGLRFEALLQWCTQQANREFNQQMHLLRSNSDEHEEFPGCA